MARKSSRDGSPDRADSRTATTATSRTAEPIEQGEGEVAEEELGGGRGKPRHRVVVPGLDRHTAGPRLA